MNINWRVVKKRVKLFTLILLTLGIIGLVAYGNYQSQFKIENEPEKALADREIKIDWNILWKAKKIPRTDTTELVAKRIIEFSKTSKIKWYDLLAIASQESLLWDFVGDSGCSQGILHINWCSNDDVKKNEALDMEFSLNWTEKKLLERGYLKDRFTAIGRHNGGNYSNKIYAYDTLRLAGMLKKGGGK